MRGAFFVVILIAMLIVGILVIRDMKTETEKGVTKTEAIDRARETAHTVDDAMQKIKDAAKQSGKGNTP